MTNPGLVAETGGGLEEVEEEEEEEAAAEPLAGLARQSLVLSDQVSEWGS